MLKLVRVSSGTVGRFEHFGGNLCLVIVECKVYYLSDIHIGVFAILVATTTLNCCHLKKKGDSKMSLFAVSSVWSVL